MLTCPHRTHPSTKPPSPKPTTTTTSTAAASPSLASVSNPALLCSSYYPPALRILSQPPVDNPTNQLPTYPSKSVREAFLPACPRSAKQVAPPLLLSFPSLSFREGCFASVKLLRCVVCGPMVHNPFFSLGVRLQGGWRTTGKRGLASPGAPGRQCGMGMKTGSEKVGFTFLPFRLPTGRWLTYVERKAGEKKRVGAGKSHPEFSAARAPAAPGFDPCVLSHVITYVRVRHRQRRRMRKEEEEGS